MRRNSLAALVVARRILRQRIRDRSAVIFAVLTPLGLAVAFSVLIPNDFQTFHTRIVIVDHDGGAYASHLIDGAFGAVAEAGIADVEKLATDAEARATLDAGNAGAMVVVPNGFSSAITSGTPTEITLLGGQFPASFELARAVVGRFASEAGAAQLMIATAGGNAPATSSAIATLSAPPPIAETEDQAPLRQAGRQTFYAAAMAIMFVFFATQYGALAIHSDRQTGTLTRLLAAPVAPGSMLLGATLASLVLGLTAMTTLVVGTTLLVHAAWGPPPLVAILLLAGAMAAAGISLLVATFARTPQQAGALNSIVALSLAALGGVFLPLSQAPSSIVLLSQLTPHAWFLKGVDTLSDPAVTLADIAGPVLVLLAIGGILGALGMVRARKALVTA